MKRFIHKLKIRALPKIIGWFIMVILAGTLILPVQADELENPLNAENLIDLIALVSKAVMKIALIVAVVALIWAGFLFVTSQGNEEKLKNARAVLVWTIIGVAIIVGTDIIISVIENFFSSI